MCTPLTGLWRALREEALFFGIDAMSDALAVTHRCTYLRTGDSEGLLHWLGTDRGRRQYRNPHTEGVVCVVSSRAGGRGNVDHRLDLTSGNPVPRDETPEKSVLSAAGFVEHDPSYLHEGRSSAICQPRSDVLWCEANRGEADSKWACVDLGKVRLRPTRYSVAYAECYGATFWNFGASEDGVTWTVLHRARNETALARPVDTAVSGIYEAAANALVRRTPAPLHGAASCDECEALTAFCRGLRKSFEVEAPSGAFYRFFRISSVSPDELPKVGLYRHSCIHLCALELYGDVHEE